MSRHTMERYLIYLLLLLSLNAFACDPGPIDTRSIKVQVRESFGKNDIIALVYVDSVEKNIEDNEFNTKFKPLEVYKGEVKEFETGWVAECCTCQMHFEVGNAYLIHANSTWFNYLYISAYGLSKEFNKVTPKELKYLRKYKEK